jgi:ABC-type sugar transport system permease subunit/ABC-type glycerol-3-phosphate transport system substrate-binding protein
MKSRLLLLMAGLAALVGIATAQQTVKKRDVVVWGLSIGPDSKGQDAVIREFEKRNPEINVKLLSMGAGRMDPQKLMTAIVGNVAPDVINQDRFTISDWASRGAFLPMNDLIERDRKTDPTCPTEEQYYKAPWEEATYDKKVYAIPTSADNRVLYWNRRVFRENADKLRQAGCDPDRPPRTWSELLKYSKALTVIDKNGRLIRAGFLPNFGNSWLYMYAFMNNASFMSEDRRKCTMNTPEARAALDYIAEGYKIVGGYENAKKFESGFQGAENDCFIVGQVVMKIDGEWILNNLARYAPNLDFQCSPPPVPDDRYNKTGRFANEKDQHITWMGGFSLAIPKGARNTEDAWKFIKFFTSEEGRLIDNRAQAGWEKQRDRVYMPRQVAHKSANETISKEFAPANPNYAQAIDMRMAEFGRVRPATFVGQLLWQEHVRAMETHLYGKASSEKALQTAQQSVQRELDEAFSKESYPELNLNVPAFLGLGVMAFLLGFFVWQFQKARLGRLEKQEAKWAYLFISPWILGFLIFTLGPMVASFFFSFTRWDVLNEARWVGTKNYSDMFTGDWGLVSKSLSNAAYLAGVGVPLGLFTGLAVALLLNAAARGIRVYRTIFYLPAIVPTIGSAVLWTWVLNPEPGKGLLNAYWNMTLTPWLHVQPPGWIQSAEWAKPALVVMGVWGAGSGMVLWLAGLKGVPTSLYEAASLDGASPTQTFWKITFPQLSPLVFFNTVMGFIGAMQEFERSYVMRPSADGPVGPDDSMLTPVFHLFNNGFALFKMGYASALAWLIFGIVLVITFIQFALRDRWVHSETK